MRIGRRSLVLAIGLAAIALAFGLGRASARTKADTAIVKVFGVAGVLTESGALWQYNPQEKKWLTIDEAFRRDGRETHILPLPVPVKSIQFMESWGFLVTTEGQGWLYDQASQKWLEIGTP